MLHIDNTPLPSPSELHLSWTDDRGVTAVNARGETVRDTFGCRRRLQAVFACVSPADAAVLFARLSASPPVAVTLPGLSGQDETFSCFVTRLSGSVMRRDENGALLTRVTADMEEV